MQRRNPDLQPCPDLVLLGSFCIPEKLTHKFVGSLLLPDVTCTCHPCHSSAIAWSGNPCGCFEFLCIVFFPTLFSLIVSLILFSCPTQSFLQMSSWHIFMPGFLSDILKCLFAVFLCTVLFCVRNRLHRSRHCLASSSSHAFKANLSSFCICIYFKIFILLFLNMYK